MARAPDDPYSPVQSVEPGVEQPNDYQHVQASPQDFGSQVGGAVQQLGNAGQQAALDANQVAIMRQQRYNEVATNDSFNKLQDAYTTLTYGAPGDPNNPGLYSLKGSDAVAAGPGAIKTLDGIREKLKGELHNDAQRLAFDQQSRRLQQFTIGEISRHLETQTDKYAVDVANASIANSARSASLAYNDDKHLDALADAAASSEVKKVQGLSGVNADPALITDAISRGKGSVYEHAIMGAAAQNDAATAKHLLDKYGDILGPEKNRALRQHLDTLGTQADANALVNQSMGLPGTPAHIDDATRARAQAVHDSVVRQGGTSDEGWGLAANAVHESSAQPNAQIGDGGISHGMFQLNKEELARYQASHGGHLPEQDDLDTQVAYARDRSAKFLTGAQGPDGHAAAIAAGFEVPAHTAQEAANRAATASLLSGTQSQAPLQGALSNGTSLASVQSKVPNVPVGNTSGIVPYEVAAARVQAATAGNYKLQQMAMSELNQRYATYKKGAADVQEASANTLMTQMITDPTKVDPIKDIANNPAFNSTEKEHFHEIYQRQMDRLAKGEGGEKGLGKSFYSLFDAITGPPNAPGTITDVHVISKIAAEHPDELTASGFEKLRAELKGRNTPEGESEATLKKLFFDDARHQISGTNEFVKDPKGDTLFTNFMAKALPAIDAAKAKGVPLDRIFSSDSPDYIGKMIEQFKRKPNQITADMMASNPDLQADQPAPEQPGLWSRIFGGSSATPAPKQDLSSPEGIRAAVHAGQITREQAIHMLSGNFHGPAAQAPLPTVNVPVAPAVGPTIPTDGE